MNISTVNQNNSFFKTANISINKNEEANKKNENLKADNNLKVKKKSLIENLQEQITKLKESKSKINGNDKLSADEKKAQLLTIDENIKELEKQIQQEKVIEKQKELDKQKEKTEEKAQKEAAERDRLNGDKVKDGVIISRSLVKLIEAKNSMGNIHQLNATKAQLGVEASYLNMRKVHKESGSFNAKQLSKLHSAMSSLENASNNELNKVINNIKVSEKSKEIETTNKSKEENEENLDNN
ncbi:hypothetical protein SAMN02745163_01873 [Clostridium cavendishii DSM 21758]|uniref:FlxA-like protein n=1 Tax=Clostridium cavendishii DSM 21758 TaxID=1121302 RepID=A0A1M6J0E6_9CLOT|nr:hypothetical protein [Clostridium cavendishii]SHJ40120.1 hypothetical protein SAMN02745163_01873 [Clostridium cavendishii DSM 21758]